MCTPNPTTIEKEHPNPNCKLRKATTATPRIECSHGRNVCEECDPCTCNGTFVEGGA